MPDKLREGDSISMQGEITRINDDGTVTSAAARLRHTNYELPEHLSLIAKRTPGRKKPLFDEH